MRLSYKGGIPWILVRKLAVPKALEEREKLLNKEDIELIKTAAESIDKEIKNPPFLNED